MFELLTWNVAGRVARCDEQIALVAERAPVVACLQEVTPSTAERWQAGLADAGFETLVSPWVVPPAGSRRFAAAIAARAPLVPLEIPGLPWPERHLAVRVDLPGGAVDVQCVHSPTSPKPERAKVRTLMAMHAAALAAKRPMVIAGDLNTPRYESREGEITSFARTRTGNLRPALGLEHDRAELALIKDLPERGWRDAFRTLHGYSRRDRSWVAARGFGYRLDHIVVSPQIEIEACDYLHEWRELGGSDHSAMWARLRLPGAANSR